MAVSHEDEGDPELPLPVREFDEVALGKLGDVEPVQGYLRSSPAGRNAGVGGLVAVVGGLACPGRPVRAYVGPAKGLPAQCQGPRRGSDRPTALDPVQALAAGSKGMMTDMTELIASLDLLGTFVFGLSGGTLAVRRGLDIFGVLVLSASAALAGGVLRDVLLGATPPVALVDESYLVTAAGAGLSVFLFRPLLDHLGKPVMLFDALGLGLFAVTGCRKALEHGLDPLASVLLGVVTAVGGGVLRDLLVTEVPRVLREEIYALAALVGAATIVAGHILSLPDAPVTIAGVLAASALRIVSVVRNWNAPRSPWT